MWNGADIEQIRMGIGERFDADYYLASYGEEIPSGTDPLAHFLRVGLPRGYKPAPHIDPLLFRLTDTQAAAGRFDAGAWEAFVDGQQQSRLIEVLGRAIPELPIRPPFDPTCVREFAPADALQYGQPGLVEFEVEGKVWRLHAPTCEFVLSRLREDRPCAIVRLSHGDWDCLTLFERYRPAVAELAHHAGLDDDQVDLLTARICEAYHHSQQMFAEHFLGELRRDLAEHSPHPDFIHAVAFKGYPTADERLFEWSHTPGELDEMRLRLCARYFRPEEFLLDATVWKRWLVAGSLAAFSDLARTRPVILVGASLLAGIESRWKLPWLLHVEIPSRHGYGLRHEILDRCRNAIAEAKSISERHGTQRPVLVTQGSSFAYWFIKRLFETDPDVFYFDFGQALYAWFFDCEQVRLKNWGKVLGPAIVRNMGLEDYYSSLGVHGDPAESLFAPGRR